MTRGQLYNILVAGGLQVTLTGLADDYYGTVSPAWVLKNYEAWLAARPLELTKTVKLGGGVTRRVALWTAEASDCDNLALGLMVHGQVGNALAAVRAGGQTGAQERHAGGLAFGVVFYTATQRVRGGHAINWFVDHDGALMFFEPGTGDFVTLTAGERASATFALAA